MEIKISKFNAILVYLTIYYSSKILWDKLLPSVLELLSVIIIAFGAYNYFSKGRIKIQIKNIVLLFGALCVYVIVNSLLQNTSQQLIRAIYEYCFYALMFFGIAYYIEKSDLYKCCKTINLWGLFLSLLSWYEYITRSYILPNNFIVTIYSAGGFRASVFTRSYLSHGMVLGFFAFVALYLFVISKNIKYLFSSVFAFVSILTTSSRGPLVSTAISCILFYIINSYRINKAIEKKFLIWISVIFVSIIGIAFLKSSFITGNETIDYFLYRTRQIINWTGDAGNAGRLKIWTFSINLFKNSPVFGIGPSHTGSWGAGSIGVTESGYLKHLCELGIIGFVIFYLFILSIIKYGLNKYKKLNKEEKGKMILYFSLVVLVMMNNLIVQSTEEIQVNFIWAFGMGGLISFGNKKNYILKSKRCI